ncbi:hypothetical protein PSACC_01855 [Paramicrosporidium saccamoebae]|uniref:Uncharacterized protein n=1 Tax=Paramicrosporidium saccamoebae TaxID=1246581 RepID=A0A2H9TKY8_9FUNG|nr:hypothetical protein PSACC_01855 [Paramicrosporidium saccamoebae]
MIIDTIIPMINLRVFRAFTSQYGEALEVALQEARTLKDEGYQESLVTSLINSLILQEWDNFNDPIRLKVVFQLLNLGHVPSNKIPPLLRRLFRFASQSTQGAQCFLEHIDRHEFRSRFASRDRLTALVFKELFQWYLSLRRDDYVVELALRAVIESWFRIPGLRELQGYDTELDNLARQVSHAMDYTPLIDISSEELPRRRTSPRKPELSPRLPKPPRLTRLTLSSVKTSSKSRERSSLPHSTESSHHRLHRSLTESGDRPASKSQSQTLNNSVEIKSTRPRERSLSSSSEGSSKSEWSGKPERSRSVSPNPSPRMTTAPTRRVTEGLSALMSHLSNSSPRKEPQ